MHFASSIPNELNVLPHSSEGTPSASVVAPMCSPLQNWSPIRSTKGVLNFVRFGLNFAQVPDNVIEFIKANQLITKEKFKNLNKFKPGDEVQITDGVFKNCVAIFKSFKSDERVILLMNILGQQQAINIKQESLIGL